MVISVDELTEACCRARPLFPVLPVSPGKTIASSLPVRETAITPAQIELVKSSWLKILLFANDAAALFYGRLFELAPEVEPLFKNDVTVQGRKLIQMLNTIVANLDNPGAILQPVRDLGVRHLGYGVTEKHYGAVEQALLWMLEQGLGTEFNNNLRAAWIETYATLADIMKTAAAEAAAER